MNKFLGDFLIELGLLSFLGMLYYFYQKRKMLRYEKNKAPLVMGYILQSCLVERGDSPHPTLDPVIEAIDDYLHNKSQKPPSDLLRNFAASGDCSEELKAVIEEGLLELD